MFDVFVSHSSRDKAVAARLFAAFRNHGLTVWNDDNAIAPGENWISRISQAAQTASNFVILISKSSSNSVYVNSELAAAISAKESDNRKRIFPVIIEKDVDIPSFISQYQYIDISDQSSLENNVSRLISAIEASSDVFSDDAKIAMDSLRSSADFQLSQIQKESAELARTKTRFEYINLIILATVFISIVAIIASISALLYSSKTDFSYSGVISTIINVVTAVSSLLVGFLFGRSKKGAQLDTDREGRK